MERRGSKDTYSPPVRYGIGNTIANDAVAIGWIDTAPRNPDVPLAIQSSRSTVATILAA